MSTGNGFIEIAGRDLPGAGAGYRIVSEGFFEALGIRVIEGRTFDENDLATGPRVTVISKRMADRYWPGESPLGRQVRALSMEPVRGGTAPWLTVIGVVSDTRPLGYLSEHREDMYTLYRQLPTWRVQTMSAVVRGRGSAAALLGAVRDRIAAIDPGIPADLALMSSHAGRVTAERRFTLATLSVFAALSLVLAAMGVYGVLSFSAAQRTREMAVRSALGAGKRTLVWLVMENATRVVALGVTAGIFGAWSLVNLIQSLVYGVEPRDLSVFAIATALLAVAGLLAAAIPARRAARVDPMAVLRDE
jgi:putative ABC transport system permease protein